MLGGCAVGGTLFFRRQMQDLSQRYQQAMAEDAGYVQLTRLNRQVVATQRAAYQLMLASNDEQMKAAEEALAAALKVADQRASAARALLPALAPQIDGVAPRLRKSWRAAAAHRPWRWPAPRRCRRTS